MELITVNQKMYDYVANCLSKEDKAEFEAEMMMDKDLEKEVARMILKKMQIERKINEHIKKVEIERMASIPAENIKKCSITASLRQKWGKLLDELSSN